MKRVFPYSSILEAASTKRNTKNSFASAMEKLALIMFRFHAFKSEYNKLHTSGWFEGRGVRIQGDQTLFFYT